MGQSRPLFVLFSSFSHSNNKHRYNFNSTNGIKMVCRDSNPGPKDGRRRRNHGAMVAPLTVKPLLLPFRKIIFGCKLPLFPSHCSSVSKLNSFSEEKKKESRESCEKFCSIFILSLSCVGWQDWAKRRLTGIDEIPFEIFFIFKMAARSIQKSQGFLAHYSLLWSSGPRTTVTVPWYFWIPSTQDSLNIFWAIIFKKMGQSRPLFVYFRPLLITI